MATKKLQILDSLIKQAENADTLDGKHADEFASTSDVETLKTQVGDTSVANQISNALEHVVRHDAAQTLTDEQKKQARDNIESVICHIGRYSPTTDTVGDVGDLYMDKFTGWIYSCTASDDNLGYTWKSAAADNFSVLRIEDGDNGGGISPKPCEENDPNTDEPIGVLEFMGVWNADVRLRGLASGKEDSDAVNMKQLNDAVGNVESVLGERVGSLESKVGDESVSNQITNAINNNIDTTLSEAGKIADAKAVGEAIAYISVLTATDDGNGIITLGVSTLPAAEEASF